MSNVLKITPGLEVNGIFFVRGMLCLLAKFGVFGWDGGEGAAERLIVGVIVTMRNYRGLRCICRLRILKIERLKFK